MNNINNRYDFNRYNTFLKNPNKYSFEKDDSEVKDYNVMIYASADNNLDRSIAKKLSLLGKVAHNNNFRFIVEYDKGEDKSLPFGKNWQAKRFVVRPAEDFKRISQDGKVLNNGGPVDMGDKGHLLRFLVDSVNKYPAKSNILVIAGHGYGQRGIGFDHGSKNHLTMEKISEVINKFREYTGKDIPILILDACLMGQMENDAKLTKSGVKVVMHSEALERNLGVRFDRLLNKKFLEGVKSMQGKTGISKEEAFAKYFLDKEEKFYKGMGQDYRNEIRTHSAVKLDKELFNSLINKRENLGKVFANLNKEDKLRLKSLILNSIRFFNRGPAKDFVDIGDIANKIVKDSKLKDKKLKEVAKDFLNTYNKLIVKNEIYSPEYMNATGMFTYIPSDFNNEVEIQNSLKEFILANKGLQSSNWLTGIISVMTEK